VVTLIMIFPPRGQPPNTNSIVPCELPTPSTNPTLLHSGVPFTVSWVHPHSGGNIIIRVTTTANSGTQSNFAVMATFPYDSALSGTFDGLALANNQTCFPAVTLPGRYTVQWEWDSIPYYNCADVIVTPPGATVALGGSTFQFADGSGVVNVDTGIVTCNSGFSLNPSTNTCVALGLSGGAAFGVFLLVLLFVSLVGFFSFVIFVRIKRPETFEKFKIIVSSKFRRT